MGVRIALARCVTKKFRSRGKKGSGITGRWNFTAKRNAASKIEHR